MALKVDTPKKHSLYQGEKKRPSRSTGVLLPSLLVLAALLFVHFLNLYLQWTVIRRELAQKPTLRTPEYTFLGFSPFKQKEIAAVPLLQNAAPNGRIYGFFDPLHPAVFLVWNNGQQEDFFDLGPVMVAVPAGPSRVSFFPGSVFWLHHGNSNVVKYYGESIIGRPWHAYLSNRILGPNKRRDLSSGSFVAKQREQSRYLRFPYLAYFFLPLVTIIAAASSLGAVMFTAFIYYVEMFFLFDYQQLFVTVPFGWVFRALNIEASDLLVKLLTVLLVVVFLVGAVFGLWHWKRCEIPAFQKRTILFFVLLPVFLFL